MSAQFVHFLHDFEDLTTDDDFFLIYLYKVI